MTIHKKRLLILALLALTIRPGGSFGGTGDIGGGDPDAEEFLRLGNEVVKWTASNPSQVSVSADAIKAKLTGLTTSLQSGQKARLIFTNDPLFDENGVSKGALFDLAAQSIKVNRPMWGKLLPDSRSELVATELFGLAGSKARYGEAMVMRDQMPLVYLRCVEKSFGPRDPHSVKDLRFFRDTAMVHNYQDTEAFELQARGVNKIKVEVRKFKSGGKLGAYIQKVTVLGMFDKAIHDVKTVGDGVKQLNAALKQFTPPGASFTSTPKSVTELSGQTKEFNWTCVLGELGDLPSAPREVGEARSNVKTAFYDDAPTGDETSGSGKSAK